MNKINDLETNLSENIDISSLSNSEIKLSELTDKKLNDISNLENKDINLKINKNIKISKNKTKFFDTFYLSKKKNDIDIVSPVKNLSYYISLVKIFFKKHILLFKLSNNKKKTNMKKIALFLIFISFFTFSNKIIIENLVTSWYENILNIKSDISDIKQIETDIKQAKFSFFVSNILIKPFSFIPNDNVRNVEYIISWGYDLSILLWKSLDLYKEISESIKTNWWIENIYITDIIYKFRWQYEEIYWLLYSSLYNYSQVWDLWNPYLNDKLNYTKDKLKTWLLLIETINKNYDTLLKLLAYNTEKKYLVIFQNNDEIRATWWFMGSTALITISNWKVVKIENSDIYALEWLINKVYTDKEDAPEWLDKITWTFWLRDANYYPLFRDSSAKIKFFLDKIDYKVDWIVYINQNIILDLLDSVEWINSEILNKEITSENFSLIMSTLVEAKVFKVGTLWTPKQVLFDFAWEFKSKLLEKKDYYSYIKIILKHVKSRDIVFYSFDNEENSLLWKLWVNWEINLNSTIDFNYPVYISVWWNKTDRYIDYRYDKFVTEVEWTCDYNTKLQIYKSHHFSKFEDEKVNELLDWYWIKYKNDILNIQWRGQNRSYVRILIPSSAEVILDKNQTLYDMWKYKIIELYINTEKLETSLTTINYTINNPNCDKYSYKFFKQPGIKKYNINFDMFWEKDKYSSIESDFIYKKDIILK